MKATLFYFVLIALAFVGCKDDDNIDPTPDQVVFDASAFVEVEDMQGLPIEGALIKVGTFEGTTDENGLLFLNTIAMNPSTYLIVEKSGFFHGSRRFYPTAGKTSYVKVVLLPEQLAGTFDASAGGIVNVNGVIQLDFPANALVDEDGQLYTGPVVVYAQPIVADDPDLSDKMPGDLIGLNSDGDQSRLASFGMVVAELRSSNGTPLQVKDGSTVEMRMQVPAAMLDKAPTTIPMWYFDEVLGLWKEEGEATLQGNTYVAELPHFSYWNCDASFEIVEWSATFVYEDASPASQMLVCLTILELEIKTCAHTNLDGSVTGMVARDELMLMEVMSYCGDVIYSQQIGPYLEPTVIGPIMIPTENLSLTTISGVAVDCNGDPVTTGYARITAGSRTNIAELDDATGEFSFTIVNCDESDITIMVIDVNAEKQTLLLSYAYAPVIDAGNIPVCETITEFIKLEVGGFPEPYFLLFPRSYENNGSTILVQDSSLLDRFFYIHIPGTTTGTLSPILAEMSVLLPIGIHAFARTEDVTVTITYYGPVGDYIIGTFSGTWHSDQNGNPPDYPLTGSFSILRE